MKTTPKFDLEDRLVDFAVMILNMTEKLPSTYGAKHLSNQITRSGTAPALLYGEAQAAESRADFVHKMKIALKELRETKVCLKIISRKEYISSSISESIVGENIQLIAIFSKSISTAKNKLKT